jgi:biopolymer transport protein TolR
MGMSMGGGPGEYNSEINVTPMVDVMLVLLIIFMVITPMLQAGVTVTLPKADNPDEDPAIVKETAIVIAIPDPGFYYVRKELFQSRDLLIARLKRDIEALKPGDPQIIYIKSSFNVPYGEVVRVVDSIREAGFDQIGLVADKNKKAGEGD